MCLNGGLNTYKSPVLFVGTFTQHPMSRARRWYTVVKLLYDMCCGHSRMYLNGGLNTYKSPVLFVVTFTQHPMSRARIWYTVVKLLYDTCSGYAIFDFTWEG